jgi:hypothetical protein
MKKPSKEKKQLIVKAKPKKVKQKVKPKELPAKPLGKLAERVRQRVETSHSAALRKVFRQSSDR